MARATSTKVVRVARLFDVAHDLTESRDLAAAHPQLTKEFLMQLRDQLRAGIGDQAVIGLENGVFPKIRDKDQGQNHPPRK